MKKAQVLEAQNVCVVCEEGITNPICPECLAREIKSWNAKIWNTVPMVYGDEFIDGGVRCLFCGKSMSICAHCYSREVYDSLTESGLEIAEEFMETFNYGLREEVT